MCITKKQHVNPGKNPGQYVYKYLQQQEATRALELAKKQDKPVKFLKKQLV